MIAATETSRRAQIRPATPADLPSVERLLAESDLPLGGVRESLKDFFVAEAEGNLVGVAGLEICRDDALLRSVAVQRSGGVRALAARSSRTPSLPRKRVA